MTKLLEVTTTDHHPQVAPPRVPGRSVGRYVLINVDVVIGQAVVGQAVSQEQCIGGTATQEASALHPYRYLFALPLPPTTYTYT